MREQYDTIIVGAGISSLICGCYLAQEGLNVLIVEQHNKPGGYCTSFERNKYKFDVGVHYLGGINNKILGKILDELNLKNKMEFNRVDPTDKIILSGRSTYIRANYLDTIDEFHKKFPKETRNISKFFDFILQKNILSSISYLKDNTFDIVLDRFFLNSEVRGVIDAIVLANTGVSTPYISALAAFFLFREYVLDPGYYPVGGVQKFADLLMEENKRLGVTFIMSKKVTKVATKREKGKEVVLSDGKSFCSDVVVCGGDVTEFFERILDPKTEEFSPVKLLVSSPSMFAVYLGLSLDLRTILSESCNLWHFFSQKKNRDYHSKKRWGETDVLEWMIYSFPSLHDTSCGTDNKSTMALYTHADYHTKAFWDKNKQEFKDGMITKAEELIPNLREYIDVEICATPITFRKYTSNRGGAFTGWMSTPDQIDFNLVSQKTSITGLYLIGHWATTGCSGFGGVSNVAFSGRKGAQQLLADIGKTWKYDVTL